MKLYHYSTERFPFIKTRREQGITKETLEEAEHKAKKMGLPLPYVDHVSFFLEPIPKETIAAIFSNNHPFWRAGQTLYEHVIESSDIDEKSFYRIVETPEIDKYTDRFDWSVKDLPTRSKYFVDMNKEMMRLGYSGYGISKMVKKCQQFLGKTEGYFIKARQRVDAADSATLYAGNVPHLMIYPIGGIIPVKSVSRITLGSGRPTLMNLLYHISFNDNLPYQLIPRQPVGADMPKSDYTEKLQKRVSFSPTIQQCFMAIYPNNMDSFFQKDQYPWLDMYVYCPTKMVRQIPQAKVHERVWDAVYTEEVCFVEPVPIIKVAHIRILNPYPAADKDENWLKGHPHGNPMLKELFLSPKIEFEIVKQYQNIPVL